MYCMCFLSYALVIYMSMRCSCKYAFICSVGLFILYLISDNLNGMYMYLYILHTLVMYMYVYLIPITLNLVSIKYIHL